MNLLSDNLTSIIIALITGIIGFFSGVTYEKKKKKQTFSQKGGDNSNLYQAGRDQNIGK
jgi:cell division protein FtsN